MKLLLILLAVSTPFLALASTDTASLLKMKPGMDLSAVQQLEVAKWNGTIGIFGDEVQTNLLAYKPKTADKPFYAILTPPEDFRLLGAPVKQVGIYFLPEGNSYKVFGVTAHFGLDKQHYQDLRNILTKQFGQSIDGHWASGSTVLLCFPPELALVDLDRQEAAARLLEP